MLLMISSCLLVLTPDKFFSKHYKRSNTSNEDIEQEFELSKLPILKTPGRTERRYKQKYYFLII